MQASQQVSLLTYRAAPGRSAAVRAFAGVAQLVEHLFCKQVVSGSIPLASSGAFSACSSLTSLFSSLTGSSEGCPSGQREQAVNLPAHAYVGSNPTPSTICLGSSAPPRWSESSGAPPQVLVPRPQNSRRVPLARREPLRQAKTETRQRGMELARRGFDTTLDSAGVAQLVESQFSKLVVEGSSPFSRSNVFSVSGFSASHQTTSGTQKQTRPASLCAGEVEARTGAERTLVRERRTGAETQPARKIAGRAHRSRYRFNAHLAQLVEHVLGKDEVTSSSLVVGSNPQP